MRPLWDIAGVLVLLATLIPSCYAHTPTGPSCSQDPNQPGCLSPIHDKKK